MIELCSMDYLVRSFEWYADEVVISDLPRDRELTYVELGDRVISLANALWSRSPSKGERVATLLKNRIEFIEVDFATTLAGKIRVGLNTRLTAEEHEYILNDCGATTLVYDDTFQKEVESIREDVPVERFVSVDCTDPFADEYKTLLQNYPADRPPVTVNPADYDYIIYTSGTTGKPKGAVHTQGGRAATSRNHLTDELNVNGSSAILHVAPLTHGSGSKVLTFTMKGARNVIRERFEPRITLETIEAEAITHMFVVPTIIKRLLAVDNRESYDTSSIKQLSYGGEPIPSDVLEEAIDYFGPVLTQVYGAAEVPHPITTLSPADHVSGQERLLRSVGRPTTNVDVQLVDDHGDPVGRGKVGEILVRGPNVMAEYWERFDATTEVFNDGWLHTGDLGTMSEDGYITIVGRKKEVIISGGLNVYPAQVEDTLQKHPAVREVAVVGASDERWGELVKAFVVLESGRDTSPAELQAFCKEHIASYKMPKEVKLVSDLPRGATGKLLKKELDER